MNIATYRSLFPVHRHVIYLNNAAASPLNTRVHARLDEYLKIAENEPHKKPPVRQLVRSKLCTLFGGSTDDYALVTSTGVGIGIAAAGFQWQKGDNVVVPMDEHWNNTFPWLALRERGVDIRLVPVDENQRVNPDAIAAAVDSNTRVVSVAAVRFDTGFRADLKLLSQIAHGNNALLLVDGIQGAGVFPINVIEDGIDILASAGFKWLLGQAGTGFLYINEAARDRIRPVLPGMFAAENNTRELRYFPDARRYETGTFAYPFFYAWTAGLDLLEEIGIRNIYKRVLELTDGIIAGLLDKNITIISPVEHVNERSAIIAFTLGSNSQNKALCNQLEANNIQVALRQGSIRVSPNFYNTEDEIDRFLKLL